MIYDIPLLLIVMSLISSVICSFSGDRFSRGLCIFLVSCSLLGNGTLAAHLLSGGQSVYYMMGHFPHPWGNELRLGMTESFMISFFSLVMLLILLGGGRSIREKTEKGRRGYYHALVCLIMGSLTVLCYTNDIFTGYVFIEISTLASAGILFSRGTGRSILASVRYMIFSLVGSGLFMMGLIILYAITGYLLMPELKESVCSLYSSGTYAMPLISSAALLSIGLAVKSGLFPFHIWMSDTYSEAAPASSAILSGLVCKGYIFLLMKIIRDVFGQDVYYGMGMNNVLFVFGVLGVIVGSVSAIREDDIFRMLAFSSACQIGYVYMAAGISPLAGTAAALYQMFAHSAVKPSLFLSSDVLCACRGDSRHFSDLTGAGYSVPLAGIVFTAGALSMIGVPATMGFVSKCLMGGAALAASDIKKYTVLGVIALSTLLNTLYFARTVIRIYTYKDPPRAGRAGTEAQKAFAVPGTVFALLNLSMGIFASFLTRVSEKFAGIL
ncbi:MAG: sodium:proton antiporter [Eubacteriaceae bacterium]|nr:sodium:proton antiporter [Eubacteriaceae bacterium]